MKNDSFFLDLGACSNTVRKSNVTPPCTYSTVFIFKDKKFFKARYVHGFKNSNSEG